MSDRTTRTNRTVLGIVGIVLLAGGAAAIVRGLGVSRSTLGSDDTPVTERSTHSWVADHTWFWPAVAGACGVVLVLVLCWLFLQFRGDTIHSFPLDSDVDGKTVLPAKALTQALRTDLSHSPNVRATSAHLVGSPSRPRLDLGVKVSQAADVEHDISPSLDRFRQALGYPVTAVVRLQGSR